jgi:hypothetical protein
MKALHIAANIAFSTSGSVSLYFIIFSDFDTIQRLILAYLLFISLFGLRLTYNISKNKF